MATRSEGDALTGLARAVLDVESDSVGGRAQAAGTAAPSGPGLKGGYTLPAPLRAGFAALVGKLTALLGLVLDQWPWAGPARDASRHRGRESCGARGALAGAAMLPRRV